MFFCPKCGKPHTKKEYLDRRFCRECGKFLTQRNKMKVSNLIEQRTKSEQWSLFPYNPYPQQLEFMKDIKNVVGSQGVLVAEACNGFGKTMCALASILAMNRRIVYATRTHEQVRQVMLELECINQSLGKTFSAVNLASRKHLCLNEKCKTLSAIDALEACRLLKESGQCPYKTEIELSSLLIQSVFSMRKLRRYGMDRSICPYFLARKVAEKCNVIVAPYEYIFNEHIRKRVKLELNGKVLVFDEAHNSDQIGQNALSVTLSERTLNNARRELEAVETSPQFINDLIAYLDMQISKRVSIEQGITLRKDLEQVLEVKNLSSFTASYANLVSEIRKHNIDKGDYPICFLNGVLNFLQHVNFSPCQSYVAIYRKSHYGINLVEYRCLDPSLAIKPVVEEAYGALIMSGTLSPLEQFTEILGLNRAKRRTYSAIAKPENVRTIIDSSVTTSFAKRSVEMISRYGERLSKLIDKIPKGVLIFFPQRKLMLENLAHWRKNKIIEQVGTQSVLMKKILFVEGARAGENRQVVEEYKRAAKRGKGAILCGVFRGRNAEGSNFPYDEARGIFLVGVPYADYSDPMVKAQIKYFNNKRKGMGEMWYIMDAFRAANQVMGRGIRHRDDWCNFILMDYRYQSHQNFIAKWAVVNGVQKIDD